MGLSSNIFSFEFTFLNFVLLKSLPWSAIYFTRAANLTCTSKDSSISFLTDGSPWDTCVGIPGQSIG